MSLFFIAGQLNAEQVKVILHIILYSLMITGVEVLLLLLFYFILTKKLFDEKVDLSVTALMSGTFTAVLLSVISRSCGLDNIISYILQLEAAFSVYSLYSYRRLQAGFFQGWLFYNVCAAFFIFLQYLYVPAVFYYSGNGPLYFYKTIGRQFVLFLPGRLLQSAVIMWLFYRSLGAVRTNTDPGHLRTPLDKAGGSAYDK